MKQEIDNKNHTGLKFITLTQIGDEINLRNPKSIRKWLIDRGITLHKLSSKCYVYKIDFDLYIEKPFVLSLRRNNPKNWKEMYKAIVNDDAFFNLMMLHLEQDPIKLPTTKVFLKSKQDHKILMELAA